MITFDTYAWEMPCRAYILIIKCVTPNVPCTKIRTYFKAGTPNHDMNEKTGIYLTINETNINMNSSIILRLIAIYIDRGAHVIRIIISLFINNEIIYNIEYRNYTNIVVTFWLIVLIQFDLHSYKLIARFAHGWMMTWHSSELWVSVL